MAQLTASGVVDIATSINAGVFGLSEAAAGFKAELNATIVVNAQLTPQQKEKFESMIDFPVRCKKTQPVTHDHPILYAMREVTRTIYERTSQIRSTSLRTLVVGAAEREMANYQTNPYVHYYFHGSESKDYTRTVTKLMDKIVKRAAERSKRSRLTTRNAFGKRQSVANITLEDARQMYDAYTTLHDLPPNMHNVINQKYEVLVFEDSFYNFGVDEYFDVFEKTGAGVAYGYGILPMEFVFPDLPENRMYRLATVHDKTHFVYTNGAFCNGYVHETAKWRTLFDSPVMNKAGAGFSLMTEIVARVGPFAIFSVVRTAAREMMVRELSLPDKYAYVKILDVFNCMDRNSGEILKPLKYFSVNAEEWFTALNYALAIDEKALTLCNVMTMIRKRGGGVALATQQLVPSWDLPLCDYYKFAQIVYLHAKVVRGLSDDINLRPDRDMVVSNFIQSLKTLVTFAALTPIALGALWWWLSKNDVSEKLVLYPSCSLQQRAHTVISNPVPLERHELEVAEMMSEQDTDCEICCAFGPKSGEQVLKCEKKHSVHTFSLTTEDLVRLSGELIDTDNDAEKLAEVKDAAMRDMPKTGFAHTCRVEYIRGGPGCGKSYAIRALADPIRDMVYSPFLKLREDYTGLKDADGKPYDFFFQTTHRGVTAKMRKAIFLDEFTSMPYEYIAIAAHNCGAEVVYLVGDTEQTCVNEGNGEGTPIANIIDMKSVSTHTLMRNFRNRPDTVNMLNQTIGYEMQAMRPQGDRMSFVIVAPGQEETIPKFTEPDADGKTCPISYTEMCFSHIACKKANLSKKFTVRSNQGSTHKYVKLYLTDDDKVRASESSQACVALSRHKELCVIVHDDSATAHAFLGKYFNAEMRQVEYKHKGSTRITSAPPDRQVLDVFERYSRDADGKTVTEVREAQLLEQRRTDLAGEMYQTELESMAEAFEFYDSVVWDMETSAMKSRAELHRVIPKRPRRMWQFPATQKTVCLDTLSVEVVAHIGESGQQTVVKGSAKYVDDGRMHITQAPTPGFQNQQFDDAVGGMVNFPRLNVALIKPFEPTEAPVMCVHPAKDSYKLLPDLVSAMGSMDELSSYNWHGSNYVKPTFKTGTMNIPSAVAPLNPRGHPKVLDKKYYALGGGNGLRFSDKMPFQELQVMGRRYLNKKDRMDFTHDSELLAAEMVDLFFREHVNEIAFDETEVDTILSEFIKSCRTKHYEAQFVGQDNSEDRVVRFHLKDTFKPAKPSLVATLDPYKCGQGISAWSKDAQTTFGGCMRIINAHLQKAFKPHFIFDNRISRKDMKGKISQAMNQCLTTSLNGITDFDMYDSQQDEFTQALERAFMRRLGVSEEFIVYYFSYRRNYIIQGSHTRGRAGMEKTSGEPATLLLNTVIASVISNFVLRGNGPVAMAGKGDDGLKRQANLRLDEHAIARLSVHTKLKMKAYVQRDAEFCGLSIVDGAIVENIPRKLNKIAAHRFRTYKHFTEVQQSLRDWTRDVLDDDEALTVAVNCKLFGASSEEMWAALDALKSISHIDEVAFFETFPERQEMSAIPVLSDGVAKVVF